MSDPSRMPRLFKPDEDRLLSANRQLFPRDRSVPYLLRQAVDFGYVHLEWEYDDYCRAAVFGEPDASIKGAGWENTVVWGKQGGGKSNLALQFGYEVYQDWDVVLRRLVLQQMDAVSFYKETRAAGRRMPWIGLDDITTIFPKQLWFLSRKKFILLQQFIATVRMRFSNIVSTTPLPQNLISSLAENVTFEIVVFPSHSYMVERYAWLPSAEKAVVSNLRKILVEYTSFDLAEVPTDVWNQYEEKRWLITDEIVKEMEESGDLDKVGTEDMWKALDDLDRHCSPPVARVIDMTKEEQGVRIDRNKAASFLKQWKIEREKMKAEYRVKQEDAEPDDDPLS